MALDLSVPAPPVAVPANGRRQLVYELHLTNFRSSDVTLEHAAGNQVVLDLGAARYAFYAHLQSGSIRVKKGDRVRRGQVLGLVGNSGNSMGPQLHFHVADGTTLAAEGLPYVFTEFEVMGRIASSERLEAGDPWRPGAIGTERHRNEMPAGDMVVSLTAADGRSPRATRPAPRR